MKQNKQRTLKLTQLALLSALLVVMSLTPLGFVMIPPVSITLMHIPVIIGAILMGPLYGAILGGVFGVISLIKATTAANVGDILFNPFLSGSPVGSVIMCIVPRILLGLVAAYAFLGLKKLMQKEIPSIALAAVLSTACHTLLVLGCMSVFFRSFPLSQVLAYIVSVNGMLEIAAAAVLSTAICKPLLAWMRTRK